MKVAPGFLCVAMLFALFNGGFCQPLLDGLLGGGGGGLLGGLLGGGGGEGGGGGGGLLGGLLGGGGGGLLGGLLGGGGDGGGLLGGLLGGGLLGGLLGGGGKGGGGGLLSGLLGGLLAPNGLIGGLLKAVLGPIIPIVKDLLLTQILGPEGPLKMLFGENGLFHKLVGQLVGQLFGPKGLIGQLILTLGLNCTIYDIFVLLNETGVIDLLETVDDLLRELEILNLSCDRTDKTCTGLAICAPFKILHLNATLHICKTSLLLHLDSYCANHTCHSAEPKELPKGHP